jgi:hypothetical protein
MHFLSLQHTVLPAAQRWISLLTYYAETHLLEDSKRAGDIWNGRWSSQLLADILIEHADTQIPPKEYISAMQWLANLTLTLQKTQTALYSTRRQILRQLALLPEQTNTTLRRPRPRPRGPRNQTLFSAWRIPYFRSARPPKSPPRYHNSCDLGPRRTPLRQAVLGYRTAIPLKVSYSRTTALTSSHRRRAPTRFQQGRSKVNEIYVSDSNLSKYH